MRKLSLLFLLLLALVAGTARADTIHLKNGSVLKGKVASFADEQFVVMLDTGSGRYMSKAMIYIGDVARIEFDSAPGQTADAGTMRDTAPPPVTRQSEPVQRDTQPRVSNPTVDTQPRNTGPVDTQPATQREPEPTQPDRSVSTTPTVEASDTDRASRKLAGQVRTVNIDVVAKRDWTSTGLIVKRGDRIRITATGSVTIDPASGQSTGPDGSDIADPKKLMQDQPTGALIGVIGADNDDFIFIGRQVDFTATRDGLLFLSVNEGVLADNTGSYKATIELQTQRK
jgi:hypothetical protein